MQSTSPPTRVSNALGGYAIALALSFVAAVSHAQEKAPEPSQGQLRSPVDACQGLTDGSEPPDAYKVAVREAVTDHGASRFIDARAQFLRAHELYPNARTLRGLGMVEFELRNYGESVRYLSAALDCRVRALDPELAQETTRLLERARAYVGEVHVALEPPSATVIVDGVTVASGPEASLVLLVGDHMLEFRAHGLRPERRSVSVRSGETKTLRVTLETVSLSPRRVQLTALERDDTGPVSLPERPRLWKKWWVWTGVGVVLAGAITGSVLIARARRDESTPSTTMHTPPEVALSTLRVSP